MKTSPDISNSKQICSCVIPNILTYFQKNFFFFKSHAKLLMNIIFSYDVYQEKHIILW